jgi:hypothetical protein
MFWNKNKPKKMKLPWGGDYTGEIKNKLPNGVGKCIYPDGTVFEGTFVNGTPKQGVCISPNGTVWDGDHTVDGVRRMFNVTFADGNVYRGQCANGKVDGNGTYFYRDGTTLEGFWQGNTLRDGKGKLTEPGGRIIEGNFVSVGGIYQAHGECISTLPNGESTLC